MANDCWNKAIIKGDKSRLEKIFEKFDSIENGVLHIGNYKTLFTEDVSDMDEQDWGSKRFTPSCEMYDDELVITGDSAWSPMIGLFEMVSVEFGVEVDLSFEEMGYDFAGKISWDTNGIIMENEMWTYWEKLSLFDQENFWEELSYRAEIYDSLDEFMEDLNLPKWKDQSVIDTDKIKKIWENIQNEIEGDN